MATAGGLAWLFWVSLAAIAYPYAIYPLFLWALNRLTGRRLPAADPDFRPSVTVICPVHNEAGRIGPKVANLLALGYPADRLQILVIGDGCTDETLAFARRHGAGRIEVLELAARSGKAAALNMGLERATGELLLFTDAGIALE